jgi:glyoxylase-like metal-dependent hydrolase (beta-lactamase superfamily II)
VTPVTEIDIGGTACFLLPDHGPALVDCGAEVHAEDLAAGLAAAGCRPDELRTLLLTHVHLDHAGGAGRLLERAPDLEIIVHERGARHLIDPRRLLASARMVFGDALDTLFGGMQAIPAERIQTIGQPTALGAGVDALPTPGHARHHLAFVTDQGDCFAGDVAGFHLEGTDYTEPHTPPPDIDLEAWHASLALLAAREPRRLAVSHLGWVRDPAAHIALVGRQLDRWAEFARLGEETFRERVAADRKSVPEPVRGRIGTVAADRRSAYAGLQMALSREAL